MLTLMNEEAFLWAIHTNTLDESIYYNESARCTQFVETDSISQKKRATPAYSTFLRQVESQPLKIPSFLNGLARARDKY